MTSQLRKKRQTILPAPTTPVRMWASLALLLLAGIAPAQNALPSRMPTPPSSVVPVRYQPLGAEAPTNTVTIQLDPPGLERLSRLDSDERLQERLRQLDPAQNLVFPEPPVLSRDTFVGRGPLWQKRQMTVEPNVLCYGKLQSVFENTNMERYGWDLGPLSVPVELLKFGADTVTAPMKIFADPCRRHECSAGMCLPGDPVPFMLYPPEITVTGSVAQLAVIGALIVIFP